MVEYGIVLNKTVTYISKLLSVFLIYQIPQIPRGSLDLTQAHPSWEQRQVRH